jgi:glycosyltransferase involved in cell wall biosynthesis
VTGFVCPPRDIGALADRVLRLVADPELRRSMGERGRDLAGEFDIDESVSRLESAYRSRTEASGDPATLGDPV